MESSLFWAFASADLACFCSDKAEDLSCFNFSTRLWALSAFPSLLTSSAFFSWICSSRFLSLSRAALYSFSASDRAFWAVPTFLFAVSASSLAFSTDWLLRSFLISSTASFALSRVSPASWAFSSAFETVASCSLISLLWASSKACLPWASLSLRSRSFLSLQ